MSRKVLIIGGVAAGPKTACRLKRLRPGWEVTVIDQDSLISYGGCGIPYYVCGDVSDETELRSTSFHMLRDEKFFADAKGVTVLTRTRALNIDRKAKTVHVRNLDTGAEQELRYDKLLLATGSRPVDLRIPGSDLDGVFAIADLHKAIEIKQRIARGEVAKAVVVGGGAIGIEMAEALTDLWGVETSLVEYMPQLLPRVVDRPFSLMLKTHLLEKNVKVYTGESATAITGDENGRVTGVKTGRRTLDADLVIMAVGVRPRSELAAEAGLSVAPSGAIIVNNRLQTSDPNIYAAGDCIATPHLVTGKEAFAPFGSLANRQGRIAADNMAGGASLFPGVVGSYIMKAFDCCIGSTGISYETAAAEGFDADYSLTAPFDRAHFFPGAAVAVYQMVFDRKTRKILGLQGFGVANDSISVRIDAAAALIAKGAVIEDFITLEMAYSPPFAPAIDPINAAACVADNLCDGLLRQVDADRFISWMEDPSREENWVVLDVRHPKEATPYVEKFGSDRWMSIPYDEISRRYRELPDNRTMIIFCNAGNRSFEVQVLLDHVGKKDNLVLCGGFNVLRRMGIDWLVES